MIWAGSPFAQRIEFSTGLPTGAVSYQLRGNDGSVLVDQEITPDAGAISCLILIAGSHNSCATPLFETRTLVWHYLTSDGLVSDRVTYRVQQPIPFAVSGDGVRSKLGIEPHELRDDDIDLVSAYADLLDRIPDSSADPYETAGNRGTILIIHAIEALAALAVIASLQLKLAQRETSGTNEFQRYSSVDWGLIASELEAHVARAQQLLDPTFDAAGTGAFTFAKLTPTPDVITGA